MDTYYASSNWHDTGGTANLKLQRWGGECRACQGDFPHGFGFLHNWLGFDMGALAVCTTSVCFYFSFHKLLKSMENGNVAEK